MQLGNELPFRLNDELYSEIFAELYASSNALLPQMAEKILHGDVDAVEYVGICYLKGSDGLQADFPKAISLLRLATEGGGTTAPFYIADCYAYGISVRKDMQTAEKFYRMAAQSPIQSVREAAHRQLQKLKK